jgi:PqqD family protein of HPr-rel-A system
MALERLGIAAGWVFKRFADDSGALYHPYTGDIHGVSELAAQILAELTVQPLTQEECLAQTILSFPDDAEDELRRAAQSHLTSLVEIGAISRISYAAHP